MPTDFHMSVILLCPDLTVYLCFTQLVGMQDVGQELDPSLEPVLAKAFVKRGNNVVIKLGDKEIDFNPDFRLYITAKLGMASTCIT